MIRVNKRLLMITQKNIGVLILISGLFALINIDRLSAQGLQVSNVSFKEEKDVITVSYDLAGSEDKTYFVNLMVSYNFGESFPIQPITVIGDVGRGVHPGKGKIILWQFRKDFPGGLRGQGFVFAVHAREEIHTNRISYIVAGSLVGGGLVYFINNSLSGKKNAPSGGGLKMIIPADIHK